MNIYFYGKLKPIYVAMDGSMRYAGDDVIKENWGEIILGLKNGDNISMLRGSSLRKKKRDDVLVVGVEYRFAVRFHVGMCNRSGQNMTVLTAVIEDYERVEDAPVTCHV